MKKVTAFNLSIEVLDAIKERAKGVSRSKSNWLDSYLTKQIVVGEVVSPVISKTIAKAKDSSEFDLVWSMYEKKGNRKTSLAKFSKMSDLSKKLMSEHLPGYVNSTPDKQFRKNLETYINQECWNDEINQRNTNGRQNQARFETGSDRYAEQSRKLQERESEARRNRQDPALVQIDGNPVRR